MQTTMFVYVHPDVDRMVKIIAIVLIGIKFLLYDKDFSLQTICLYAVLLIIYWQSHKAGVQGIFLLIIVILGAKDVRFSRIVRCSFFIGLPILIFAMIASQTGMVEDLVYYRWWGKARHSFGIIYPTDFAAHVFYLMTGYVILRDAKLRWFEYLGIVAASVFVYHFCDARLNTGMILLTALSVWLIRLGFFSNRFISRLLPYAVPVCALIDTNKRRAG